MKSLPDIALVIAAAALLTGCASSDPQPATFAEGIGWVAQQHHLADARTQRVDAWPCLRVDPVLEDRLNAALTDADLEQARALTLSFLDEAHRLALQVANVEMLRMDDEAWRQVIRDYFNGVDVTPGAEVRQRLAELFVQQTDLQVWLLRREVEQAASTADLRRAMEPIREHIQPSVKTSATGKPGALAVFALPAALARSAIHDAEATCQMDEDFDAAVHFTPASAAARPPGAEHIEHWDLLAAYAPIVVQEHPKSIDYPRSADGVGRVTAADDATIDVDVARPAVYGYTRTVLINRQPHIQLTYALWYPQRPRLKTIDAEAGKIDGATLRITLDAQQRPAVIETLNNCGCHHRIYPSESLEAAAAAAYGSPLKDKAFTIERDMEGKYDLIIPKLLKAPGSDARPMMRCRAGTHAIVDVDYSSEHHRGEPVAETRTYDLLPYDELEALRTPGGNVVSMFLDNGLVRGAERLEGDLFKPLGMLNAGQPRQRGTQLIQWDQYDFDSPRLLESTLRLPPRF